MGLPQALAMNAPLPFAPVLIQARDLFRDRLFRAVAAMFDGADADLEAHANRTADMEERNHWLDARDFVRANRDAIEKLFRARFDREFHKRSKLGDEMIPAAHAEYHLEDFALVAEDDLEETLRFDDMAERLRRFCEEELSALDQRVGVLMGDANLDDEHNPFGPRVICDAYRRALKVAEAKLATRLVLVRHFDDHVLETIRATYREVNELLASNGILPKIRYGIARHEATPAALAPRAPMPAIENAQDVFAMLRGMLAGGPSVVPGERGAAMGVGGIALLQGGQLQLSLTRLQLGETDAMGQAAVELAPIAQDSGSRNVLHELKDTSVGAALDETDSATLDIVAMLFDEIFDDDRIPEPLKSLIGRLQLPILKVALADKALFSDKAHPARQLVDVLGRIGARVPPDFDKANPLFAKLKAFIEELVEGFREKLDIFDEVRERLEALIAEEEARVAKANEAPRREMDEAEALALAKSAAEDAIRTRVERADHPPQVVVEFLSQHWLRHLVMVHARDHGQGPAWEAALKAIDDLLWSVAAKDTIESRRQVAHSIPALLKTLKAGVAEAGIAPGAVSGFFILLMKRHTEVIHGAPLREKPQPIAFSEKVTVQSPFAGGGTVDVSTVDLDFTKPGALPGGPPATPPPMIPLPPAMVEGAWVETLHPFSGEPTLAQLHYVSPLGSHFLFVDRQGKKVFECSRTVLARHLRESKVTLLQSMPPGSLFDRTIDGLVHKLRT